jgi:hypothetical protein
VYSRYFLTFEVSNKQKTPIMSFDYYEFKREKRAYNRTAPKKLDYIYALEAKGIYPRLNTRLKALKAACEKRGIKVYSNHRLSPAYNGGIDYRK